MKFIDEYRESERCERLLREIRQTVTRPRTLMEVCGGQTHGLLRFGIDAALRDEVRLIHGPGCPVCVTPMQSIDAAISLSRRPDVILASFGDMLRVPGSRQSLLAARALGANVQVVYSPLDAVRMARQQPARHVVFFAVGFETTAPATALAVEQAASMQLQNFSLLVAHVRVLPAMEMIACDRQGAVEAFLGAGHVCTVTGFDCYRQFVAEFGRPVAVTGFEPVDLLTGILECVGQLERGEARVANCYGRSVTECGNQRALSLMGRVYGVIDRFWRGLGIVPGGGLQLRPEWSFYDAEVRFGVGGDATSTEASGCRSGEVLTGQLKPPECEHFGVRCTPESPLGAPMVSAEGACAAYYRYAPTRVATQCSACEIVE